MGEVIGVAEVSHQDHRVPVHILYQQLNQEEDLHKEVDSIIEEVLVV